MNLDKEMGLVVAVLLLERAPVELALLARITELSKATVIEARAQLRELSRRLTGIR